MDILMRYVRNITLIMALAFSLVAGAQVRRNEAYLQYIEKFYPIAIEQQVRYKIPASITLAQGLLESGAGRSELATRGNNHFGIKCHGWTGRTTYHDDDEHNECFRAYDSARESYEDHSIFLTTSQRYRSLFDLRITDYKGWAHGLKKCGYATSPTYASSLIQIIETYNLHQYDNAKHYDHFMAEHGSSYDIYAHNKNYFIKARHGDTFQSISKQVGVSARKLASYNERDKNDELGANEVIWLKKKRTKADKVYKKKTHVVRSGESMYTISQLYGIRLKSLYKMNHLSPDYQIRVGDTLKVR